VTSRVHMIRPRLPEHVGLTGFKLKYSTRIGEVQQVVTQLHAWISSWQLAMIKGHTHAVRERFLALQSATAAGRATADAWRWEWDGLQWNGCDPSQDRVGFDRSRYEFEYAVGKPLVYRLVRNEEGSPAGTAA
jgi:hypothetical protein